MIVLILPRCPWGPVYGSVADGQTKIVGILEVKWNTNLFTRNMGIQKQEIPLLEFCKKKRDLEVKESRPYQQCRLNMLLLLVWFELWTQYPGPLCLWQCLVLFRTYEPIFSQFGDTLSNMCIRNAMASLKQTINQLIPALLTLLVMVPSQAFYRKPHLIWTHVISPLIRSARLSTDFAWLEVTWKRWK